MNKQRNRRFYVTSIIVICALLLAACDVNPLRPTPTSTPEPTATAVSISTPVPAPTATPLATPTRAPKSPIDIVKDLRPSTVRVQSTFPNTPPEYPGVGTGIVYDAKNGYIVTNAHVVEGASSIGVSIANSTKTRPARVVGYAWCDDLAVLKVEDTQDLASATLGDSSNLELGAEVLALGYPASIDDGNVDVTPVDGIVSKLHVQDEPLKDLIQMTAGVTYGNSGGPLANRYSEVVGINSYIFVNSRGEREPSVNYAISMSYAKPIIKLLEQGKHQQYIGLGLYPNRPDFKEHFGTDKGLIVIGVTTGSPADRLRLQPGDLLLKLENTEVNSSKDLCGILRSHIDGDQLRVKIYRPSTRQTCEGEVTMGKKEAESNTPSLRCDNPLPPDHSNPVLVRNDFNDGNPGPWWVGTQEQEKVSWGVANGQYTISFAERGSAVQFAPVPNLADGIIAADVRPEGEGSIGLVARYSFKNEAGNNYVCWIDASSYFGCFKMVAGSTSEVVKPQQSTVIKLNDTNMLKLVMEGTQLKFYINGQLMANTTDSSLTIGDWGVWAAAGQPNFKAHFDWIEIVKLK